MVSQILNEMKSSNQQKKLINIYYVFTVFSWFGNGFHMVSAAWLVLQASGSGAYVSMLVLAGNVVSFLFAKRSGLVADKFPRLGVCASSELARFLAMLITAIFVFFSQKNMAYIILLSEVFISGAWIFFSTASAALLHEISPRGGVIYIARTRELILQISTIIGAACAGWLLEIATPSLVIGTNSILSLPTAFLCWKANHTSVKLTAQNLEESEGYDVGPISKRNVVWVLTIVGLAPFIEVTFLNSVIPTFCRYIIGSGADTYGIIEVVFAAGALVSSLFVANIYHRFSFPYLTTAVLATLSLALWGLSSSRNLAAAMIFSGIVGLSGSLASIIINSRLNEELHWATAGRVHARRMMFRYLACIFIVFPFGVLCGDHGIPDYIRIVAILCAAAAVLLVSQSRIFVTTAQ